MYNYLLPNIVYGGYSDKGIRGENQDSFRISVNNTLATFLVADGVGGHSFGGDCSKGVADSLINEVSSIENKSIDYIKSLIEKKYNQINEYIYNQGRNLQVLMATTISTVNFVDNKCLISNIGDTKVFLVRSEKLILISEEHTVAYDLFKSKKITYEEYLSHSKKHVLSKAVGSSKSVSAFYNILEINDDDVFLILSDGVYNFLSEGEILMILKKSLEKSPDNLNELCKSLVEQAVKNKSNDNATAVAIYIINS